MTYSDESYPEFYPAGTTEYDENGNYLASGPSDTYSYITTDPAATYSGSEQIVVNTDNPYENFDPDAAWRPSMIAAPA